MKTYLIRWMPIQHTPGSDVREKTVQAHNEHQARSLIGEPYSHLMIWEVEAA